MKGGNFSKPGNSSIICSNISTIPYSLIFTTKFNDTSIFITIISWDYMNVYVANEYVCDVTITTQVIMNNQCCSRQISQSDCSIHIKLNYYKIKFKVSFLTILEFSHTRHGKTVYVRGRWFNFKINSKFKCVRLNISEGWIPDLWYLRG